LGYDRFLSHLDDGEANHLEGFIRMIERAKRRGLVNLRAVVIAHYLDPNHDDIEEMEIVTKGLIISTASTNNFRSLARALVSFFYLLTLLFVS
jgi:hypothetical protein